MAVSSRTGAMPSRPPGSDDDDHEHDDEDEQEEEQEENCGCRSPLVDPVLATAWDHAPHVTGPQTSSVSKSSMPRRTAAWRAGVGTTALPSRRV
jgi:hypothetical protein